MLNEQLNSHLRSAFSKRYRGFTYDEKNPTSFGVLPPHELQPKYLDMTRTYGQTGRFEIKGPMLLMGDSVFIEWQVSAFNTTTPSTSSVKDLGSFAFIHDLVWDISTTEQYQVLNDELFADSYLFKNEKTRKALRQWYHCDHSVRWRQKLSESTQKYRLPVPIKRNTPNHTMEMPLEYIPKGKIFGFTFRFRPINEIYEGPTGSVPDISNLRLHYELVNTLPVIRKGVASNLLLPQASSEHKTVRNPLHLQPHYGRIVKKLVPNGYSGTVTLDISENASAAMSGFLLWAVPSAEHDDGNINHRLDEVEKITDYEFRKSNTTVARFPRGYEMTYQHQSVEDLNLPPYILYHPLGRLNYFTHHNDHMGPSVKLPLRGNDYTVLFKFGESTSEEFYLYFYPLSIAVREILYKGGVFNYLKHLD